MGSPASARLSRISVAAQAIRLLQRVHRGRRGRGQDLEPPGPFSEVCQRAADSLRRRAPTCFDAAPQATFPLFAMRMDHFLQLGQLHTWEDALALGLLVEWSSERHGALNFVSHQWLDPRHPDPSGDKLRLIQSVFQAIGDGDKCRCMAPAEWEKYSETYTDFYAENGGHLSLSEDEFARSVREGYVWLDLFSVPQRDVPLQRRAIGSLAAYVAHAANVFVVAPPMLGAFGPCDLDTWSRRGWCRVEKWAAELRTLVSGSARRPLLVEGLSQVRVSNFSDQMTFGVRQGPLVGQFSVPSDVEVIRPVLHDMYDRKLAALLRVGDALHFQWFLFCRPHVCAEPGQEAGGDGRGNGDESLQALLRRYGFSGPQDVLSGHPFTPMFCAAAEGNLIVTQQMIDAGLDVNGWDALGVNTPLHGACSTGASQCVAMLLRAGANPVAATLHRGIAPLHRAAAIGDAKSLALLLDACAAIDCQRSDTGQTAAHLAAAQKHADCYTLLVTRGANTGLVDDSGVTAEALWSESQSKASRENDLTLSTPALPDEMPHQELSTVSDLPATHMLSFGSLNQVGPRHERETLSRLVGRRSSAGLSCDGDSRRSRRSSAGLSTASHFSETLRRRWSNDEGDRLSSRDTPQGYSSEHSDSARSSPLLVKRSSAQSQSD